MRKIFAMFTKMVSPKVHKFMPIMWSSYGRTPTWEVGGPELAKGRNRGGRDGRRQVEGRKVVNSGQLPGAHNFKR